MSMEYLLTRRFSVGQEQVYALATNATCSEGCSNAHCHCQHAAGYCRIKIGQISRVVLRYYKGVTGVNRLNIQECQNVFCFTDNADWPLASDQFTKDAGF